MPPYYRGLLLASALSLIVVALADPAGDFGVADNGLVRPRRRPVLVDSDPGMDDAFALLWVCSRLDVLELVAFTAVPGNVGGNNVLRNAVGLMRLLSCDANVTLGLGATDDSRRGDDFMGIDGMGGHAGLLPDAPSDADKILEAGQAIVDSIDRFGPELAIIAIGPLSNLAAAERIRPGVLSTVRDVLIMGGAVVGGNVEPNAEFNFWFDAPSAKAVLRSVTNAVLFPLDITEKLCFGADFSDRLSEAAPGPRSEFFSIVRSAMEKVTLGHGYPCLTMPDPYPVGFLLHPSLFTVIRRSMDVGVIGGMRGNSFLAPSGMPNIWQAATSDQGLFDHFAGSAAMYLAGLRGTDGDL